ncbi:MAG: hypothetical protein A2Y15_00540 [Clostridiales bacterium GWF2_36_10]|nr:MAG: hypothetical protein A2Y15_00540 [Clostridiales bacterium GWF2_36_10]HAN21721.1 hypothetical protein [Clostridiales bacterium]
MIQLVHEITILLLYIISISWFTGNTIIDSCYVNTVSFTVEGKIIETEDKIYDKPISLVTFN